MNPGYPEFQTGPSLCWIPDSGALMSLKTDWTVVLPAWSSHVCCEESDFSRRHSADELCGNSEQHSVAGCTEPKSKRTWLCSFFWLSKRVSFICLFLWQKRSSFFRSAGPVSAHCRARLRQEIKCTHQTHSVLWGSEIWSQVVTGDVYKRKVGKNMSLGGVYSLRTTVETRAEQAWHSENSVTGQFRNRLYFLLLHKNKMTVYSLRSPISN